MRKEQMGNYSHVENSRISRGNSRNSCSTQRFQVFRCESIRSVQNNSKDSDYGREMV